MIRILLSLTLALLLTGCDSDPALQSRLAGEWDVRIRLTESVSDSLSEVKESIRGSIDSAREEIRTNLGDKDRQDGSASLAEGLDKLMDGIGDMMDGLAEMSRGLGSAITRSLSENLELRLNLHPDGTLEARSLRPGARVDIDLSDNRWSVENGKWILLGDDEPQAFNIRPTRDGFDLIGKSFVLQLTKPSS